MESILTHRTCCVNEVNGKSQRVFEKLWTVTDTAEFLQVSEKTVYDWVHKREIPFHKVHRLVRFKPREIEKWLNSEGRSHYGNRQT